MRIIERYRIISTLEQRIVDFIHIGAFKNKVKFYTIALFLDPYGREEDVVPTV